MKHDGWEFFVAEGRSRVGIVLIHEIFGFDDYIKSAATELSKNEYWAGAVDLFRKRKPSSLEEAMKMRETLSRDDVLDALGKGLQLLRSKIGRDGKVGSMGFCMGGGFALLGACNLDFDFCIDYYGMIQNAEEVAGLKGPMQLILAGEDERIDPWAYQSLLPAATKHKKRVDVHLYPNVRHAFHRANWPGHNPEAARDAWSRTLQFLSNFKRQARVLGYRTTTSLSSRRTAL